ncbi:unnamed protein product [Lathyrus sativus]|nr:unnamed protein product [Lathyrus sativus]
MMFACTSPGDKLDNKFNNVRGPPTIRIQGQACHHIGSLLPPEGQPPKFANYTYMIPRMTLQIEWTLSETKTTFIPIYSKTC